MQNNSIPSACFNNPFQHQPTVSKEKTAFYKAGIVHSIDTTIIAQLRQSSSPSKEQVSKHEKLRRTNYQKRVTARELLSTEIDRLSALEQEDLIIRCYRSNIGEWEEKERKINKLFIDWHFNPNYFDGKRLTNSNRNK